MKLSEISSATAAALVSFYNENSGKPAIKKFADRKTAEKRVSALIEALPAPAAPKKEKAPKAPASRPPCPAPGIGAKFLTGEKGKDAKGVILKADGEGFWEVEIFFAPKGSGYKAGEVISLPDTAMDVYENGPASSYAPKPAPLIPSGERGSIISKILANVKDNSKREETLMELLGKSLEELKEELSFARTGKRKAPSAKDSDSETSNRKGRKSAYSGKIIRRATPNGANPRRAGTHGFNSFELIPAKEGIEYDAYIKAGGRNNDFLWDLARNFVTVG